MDYHNFLGALFFNVIQLTLGNPLCAHEYINGKHQRFMLPNGLKVIF
jgi:hypothetical protein